MDPVIENFHGNRAVVEALWQMAESQRVPQTLLIDGPSGVGKATLVRRFAAKLLGSTEKIEQDDLSLAGNAALIADREKWTAEKRNEDPLVFSSHPDFLTFPPDGPLRQITMQQMRLLKERAQYKPLHGNRRVFLIDRIDRANEQAANSLLKVLEEPPEHLVILMTAENAYDLLPTIRSRSVALRLNRLEPEEMEGFLKTRKLADADRRVALANGSPGMAVSWDLAAYDGRRGAMLQLLQVGARRAPFGEWARHSESIAARKTEKLELYLDVLYVLLEDILLLREQAGMIRNPDLRAELQAVADAVSFPWLRKAVGRVDELVELVRRNIQKSIALDALAVELRRTV